MRLDPVDGSRWALSPLSAQEDSEASTGSGPASLDPPRSHGESLYSPVRHPASGRGPPFSQEYRSSARSAHLALRETPAEPGEDLRSGGRSPRLAHVDAPLTRSSNGHLGQAGVPVEANRGARSWRAHCRPLVPAPPRLGCFQMSNHASKSRRKSPASSRSIFAWAQQKSPVVTGYFGA